MRKVKLVQAIVAAMLFGLCASPTEAQKCSMYKIELQGQVGDSYGGKTFGRAGTLMILPGQLGGSGNAAEVWIQSGNPVTAPQVGSIFVTSNTALIGSLSSTLRNGRLQLASVHTQRADQGLSYSVRIADQFAITQGGMFNLVNLSSGIAADAKLVDSGVIQFTENSQSGQITGSIELVVRNWQTTSHQASIVYRATLRGTFAGQTTSCVAASR
jgi:hypothetical protein